MPGPDSNRLFDVLQTMTAGIDKAGAEMPAGLMIGLCRNSDPTGGGERFEADGDVHIVPEYFVFVGQHVSHVDAETKPHGPVCRKVIVPFRHHLLHRDRSLDRANDAWKL